MTSFIKKDSKRSQISYNLFIIPKILKIFKKPKKIWNAKNAREKAIGDAVFVVKIIKAIL